MYCSRFRSAAEMRRDKRLSSGHIDPVTIGSLKGVVPEELWLDIASARVENGPLWRKTPKVQGNEIYILVYRPSGPDAPWTPGTAFLGSVGLRVAVLRDDPLKAVRSWSRFLVLHELAHVSSEGVGLHIARWRMLLTMMHAAITVLLLGPALAAGWGMGLLLLAAAGSSVWSFVVFERLSETYADATAYRQLPSERDRARVEELIRYEVEEAAKKFGDRYFHTRLWRSRLASLVNPRRVSFYNPMGGTIYDPSVIPFILASLAAAILAWVSTPPSSSQLWVYTVWCLCCELAAVVMHVWAKHIDAGIRIGLNSSIVASMDGATLGSKRDPG
jgi:hypothetical protein